MTRIYELDYIRGIAMLMVVMGHVLLFSLKIEHTALIGIIGICEMPLFFVVSGYLTHKEREENFKRMLSRLLIRSRTLLVPLVVWSIVRNICDGTVSYSLSDIYRGGYWFFLALWWCDVLNMFSAYLSKKFRLGMLGDALLYGFVYAVILLGRIKNIDLGGVLPVQSVQYYFPFFVMGLLMRKYQFLNGMVLNKYSYAVGMLLLIIGWYFSFIESFVIWFVAALGAVVVVWMACREINSDLKVARILSIVGMNTLPIYAIHYLFIGVLPNTLHEMVYISNGFFFQLVISFVYAVFAIILCLLVDRILSLNPITRMLFWGESKKREWRF
ncbi:acyltransferase [Parabacteroides merdae]|jgi:hypothetical protein|nr:acyltransferase [Parabacteroides merdae]MDB8973240.1 acyltransferase [Parabacteroides merdae]MDB8977629.1 acyltransferase [Parabacteroides merdae]MDB8984487.1 acyltransferase [Parabacteroides merdae]MDB8991896.1 acyltransferase [Parabacteroides merdae]